MATSKVETNRKNALNSTGPKTLAGKAAVSKNAVKHGAYSEALTMLRESPESFATLRAGMVESFRPVGAMEENLVERMASLWWRMERAKMVANQSLWMSARRRLKGSLEDMLEMDPFNEAVALDKDECRFPGAWDYDKQERLLRHEVSLERSFFRVVHELERLQARREGGPVPPAMVGDLNLFGAQD